MDARGLLIGQPFADWVVDGKKTWEIRGRATKVRGRVAIIASGTGTVIGTCEFCDVEGPLTLKDLRSNPRKRNLRTSRVAELPYSDHTYAWVLRSAMRLRKAVPYDHPQGTIIWVKLGAALARRDGVEVWRAKGGPRSISPSGRWFRRLPVWLFPRDIPSAREAP